MAPVLCLSRGRVKIIVHIVKNSKIAAVAENRFLRFRAGKESQKICVVLQNIPVGVRDFVAHRERDVHRHHQIIIIRFHRKRKIISLHVLLTDKPGVIQRFGVDLIAAKPRIHRCEGGYSIAGSRRWIMKNRPGEIRFRHFFRKRICLFHNHIPQFCKIFRGILSAVPLQRFLKRRAMILDKTVQNHDQRRHTGDPERRAKVSAIKTPVSHRCPHRTGEQPEERLYEQCRQKDERSKQQPFSK